LAFVAVIALVLAVFIAFTRDELLLRASISGQGSVSIYGESAISEPPRYLYCEITRAGMVVLPGRPFMGIGIDYIPGKEFVIHDFPEEDLLAITRGRDILFLCDPQANQVWPDPYTLTDAESYAFAKIALRRIEAQHPGLRCFGIEEYVCEELWRSRGEPDPALVPDAP
jgi:hypothetical protein